MSDPAAIPQKLTQFGEFFRYIFGCGCSLLLKIVFTSLLNLSGFPIWISYLLAHSVIIFCSFFFHYLITFRRKIEGFWKTLHEFFRFTAAVIAFNLLDYFLVVIGITRLEEKFFTDPVSDLTRQIFHAAMIVLSSCLIFVLRFFCYRYILRKKS